MIEFYIIPIVAVIVGIYAYSNAKRNKMSQAIGAAVMPGLWFGALAWCLLTGQFGLIFIVLALIGVFLVYLYIAHGDKDKKEKGTPTKNQKGSVVLNVDEKPKAFKQERPMVKFDGIETTAPEAEDEQEHPAEKKEESPVKESGYVPEGDIPTESKEEPKLYDDEGALNPAMEKLEGMSYTLPVAKRKTEGFSTDTLFLIRLARKYQGEWDRVKKMFVFPVKKDWDTALRNRNGFIEEANHKLGFKSIKVKEEEEKKKRSDTKTREQVNKNAKTQSDQIEKRASEFESELMEVLLKTGDYFINNGTNEYDAFEKKLVTNFGEKVQPYIGAVWNIINAHPENIPFDPKLTMACFEYVGSSLLEGDTIEEIRLEFVRDYDRPDLLPLIDVVYAGYNKYMGIESE